MIERFKKLARVDWDDVQVRDLRTGDVELVIDYFYEKRVPFLFSHIDRSKMQPESVFRERYLSMASHPEKAGTVTVEYRGQAVGVHTLTPVLPTHTDFHAHFWERSARGQGVAIVSTYKACEIFFNRFGFERIYLKPPKDNPMSSGAARKLPFRLIGETILDYPILQPGVAAWVYEVTRAEFFARGEV